MENNDSIEYVNYVNFVSYYLDFPKSRSKSKTRMSAFVGVQFTWAGNQ